VADPDKYTVVVGGW